MTKMIIAWRLSLVIIVLFSSFFSNTFSEESSSVRILNSMPKNSGQVDIHCISKHHDLGSHILKQGEDYKWDVEENATYFCEAVRLPRNIASWHAFEPQRDVDHDSVFWLVSEGGFFLSWDNSTWVKNATWETD